MTDDVRKVQKLSNIVSELHGQTRKSFCVNARGIPARHVAIATPCYSGGGGGVPRQKNFFPSLNMYQAKSGCQKFFPLPVGGWGGSLNKNFFFQSEHVSSQIWCQKFFPLPVGGWGVPQQKFFFPVWTCIKPNLLSKIFPLYWGLGTPPTPHPRLDWDPLPIQDWIGIPPPPPSKAGLGPPPPHPKQDWDPPPTIQGWRLDRDPPPPPPKVNRQTFPSINITFPRTTYAGGNYRLVAKKTKKRSMCWNCSKRKTRNFSHQHSYLEWQNTPRQ